MDRLTVLCFAGTYALALAADLARFVVRVPPAVERYSALGLTALGWLVQTVYLANLALREHALPVTSIFESLLVLAWVLAAIDLYLAARPDRLTAAGPVLLGLVLAVLVVAGQWAPRNNLGTDWGGWPKFWGTVHGLFLLMGAVFTCLAFVFGVLYPGAKPAPEAQAVARYRLAVAQSGTIRAVEPGGDHAGVPAPDRRHPDRRGSDCGRAPIRRLDPELDRSESAQHRRALGGVRGLAARPLPARVERPARDGADPGGVRVPRLRDGRRWPAVAHRSRPGHSRNPRGGEAMKLLALGVDHRSAPASLREALALEGPRRDDALDSLRSAFPSTEFVILSTCNRVELYCAADVTNELPSVDELAAFLADIQGIPAETLAGHLLAHHDEAVVGHLFRVASSLESLVLGEGQILGQVRDAYRAAQIRNAVGSIFHALFQHALRVGKKVREETGMDQGKLSVASVAVDVARSVFDSFKDKTVLVIGAGKMADLTLQHLSELRPGRILITNRSLDRARAPPPAGSPRRCLSSGSTTRSRMRT